MTALDDLRQRAEAAEARLLELENAASWMTSCTSCARILDSAYAETMRREQAEARVATLEAALRRHTHTCTDSKGTVCGGCLEPAPCPDTALLGDHPYGRTTT